MVMAGEGEEEGEGNSNKLKRIAKLAWQTFWKSGRDDPRRVTHSIKVGLALTLASSLYLIEPLFQAIGENEIWAVMTVVVVFEFTAGATLCKGLNRATGTLLAGSLAFLIKYIGTECGQIMKAIFIGVSVFVIGAATTYVRFIPYMKKNYDYGVLIFLLTFNIIIVSSYRIDNVTKLAHERFYTIVIGIVICLLMTLFVLPNWSGEDLHNSTISKLEGLANSIEACVKEYFDNGEIEEIEVNYVLSEDPIYKGYKAVLDSKSTDETMALYANWEPRHSIHCHKLPGKQYVAVGAALRHFGYTVVALHGCLKTEIQTPRTFRITFKDPCIRVAKEVSKFLVELANSIRNRRHCGIDLLFDNLQEALQDLNNALKSQPRLSLGSNIQVTDNMQLASTATTKHGKDFEASKSSSSVEDTDSPSSYNRKATKRSSRQCSQDQIDHRALRPTLSSKNAIASLDFSEALPFAAFASLLIETVARLDRVVQEVKELGKISRFKEFEPDDDHVVVNCTYVSNTGQLESNALPIHLPNNSQQGAD